MLLNKLSKPKRPKSFKHLLLRSLFTSIFIFFTVFSIILIWLSLETSKSLILNNAKETVQVLAKQGTLALLTASKENADMALEQVLAFPDVAGAGLFYSNGDLLVWQGEEAGIDHFQQKDWSTHTQQEIIIETEDHWHICTSVTVIAEDEEFQLLEPTAENIGFATISFSKKSLKDITFDLYVIVLIASIFVVLILPVLIIAVTRRLLAPLHALSDAMNDNFSIGTRRPAPEQGAREIQLMAHTFNSLMSTLNKQDAKLKNHRDRLEAKVKLRTKELIIARDAALSSNRLKTEFLTNVTHELRSPIQSIIGYIELIREEAENEGLLDILTDLDKVTRNSERLFKLINSILDLSKIEAGKMDLNLKPVPVRDLMIGVEEATLPLASHNNNIFTMTNNCSLSYLTIDYEKTLQILINLVSNALKFTHEGRVDLIVTQNIDKLVFEVIDNGIGIPAEQLENIFNQFQQVDGGISRNFGGTGLGLAISKQFCDMMHGEILVKSEEGQGSTFRLSLPIET